MVMILLWIVCGWVAAAVAGSKGGSAVLGFLAGLLLGPLGIIIALFMGTEEGRARVRVASGEAKRCPMCAEAVLADAIICKHCRHDFYAEFKDED